MLLKSSAKAVREPLINVMSAGQTRQKLTKKRSLRVVNEHFEAIFNAVWPSVIVNQRLLRFIEIKKIVAYMLDS